MDPGRLLLLWAGNRDLAADVLFDTRALAELYEVEDELAASFVLGGFAAYRLDIGLNTVADYDTVLAYGPPKLAQRMYKRRRSGRTRILVLEGDPLLATYGSHTPMPQTYVDIFNLPGWQAARFYLDMTRRLIGEEAA